MSDFDFDEEWNRTEVTVTSPNEQVWLTLHGNAYVRLTVDPGYYARAPISQIQNQIGQAARLLVPARTKAFFRLRSIEAGEPRHASTSRSPKATAYRTALQELAVEGESSDGSVRVFSTGLTAWSVITAPGVQQTLDADAFSARASEAFTKLLHDQLTKAASLNRSLNKRGHHGS